MRKATWNELINALLTAYGTIQMVRAEAVEREDFELDSILLEVERNLAKVLVRSFKKPGRDVGDESNEP